LKWTRKTTEKIADELRLVGISVSPNTVGRLLEQLGYRLRTNQKTIARGSPADRDAQFQRIAEMRQRFTAKGLPIVSIDTKKKEQVALFKNAGKEWALERRAVLDHDFPSDAKGVAIPYGIYLPIPNVGTVFVGTSHDTPEFAVDCIEAWWRLDGRDRFPSLDHLLILADAGGSNGHRCRAWKYFLQHRLCDSHRLTVTVAHYPSGASKWNPIEHRLFSAVSKNWAGVPLESYETILNFIRTTTTKTGLRVQSTLVNKEYETGIKITVKQMASLSIEYSPSLPRWNYTIRPR
jgi:Rhodopirellula transposase DDE domain